MAEELPRMLPKPLGTVALNLPHLHVKDTRLLITPEKTGLAKQEPSAEKNDENMPKETDEGVIRDVEKEQTYGTDSSQECARLIPAKLSSLDRVATDPNLDVTPEKPKTVLKGHRSLVNIKNQSKTKVPRVRFNVPMKDGKKKTQEYESGSTVVKEYSFRRENEPFAKRAALFAQRNPLGKRATDSQNQNSLSNASADFESSASTNTDSSFFTSLSSVPSVTETENATEVVRVTLPCVKLKTANRQSAGRAVTTKRKQDNRKDRITVVKPQDNQSKLIEQVTKPMHKPVDEKANVTKQEFLKKNSSSHRHKHTVRYSAEDEEENPLSTAAYNSTIALGQKLQGLKMDEFNAKGAVKKKLEENERFRTYVAEKTAEATNINPEEAMYQNLVSVTVPNDHVLYNKSTRWRRLVNKSHKPKISVGPQPNIWDFYYPDDLYEAEPEYVTTEWFGRPRNGCGLQIKPCLDGCGLSPVSAAKKLDNHEQLWNGAWGRHLPQERDRVDIL